MIKAFEDFISYYYVQYQLSDKITRSQFQNSITPLCSSLNSDSANQHVRALNIICTKFSSSSSDIYKNSIETLSTTVKNISSEVSISLLKLTETASIILRNDQTICKKITEERSSCSTPIEDVVSFQGLKDFLAETTALISPTIHTPTDIDLKSNSTFTETHHSNFPKYALISTAILVGALAIRAGIQMYNQSTETKKTQAKASEPKKIIPQTQARSEKKHQFYDTRNQEKNINSQSPFFY